MKNNQKIKPECNQEVKPAYSINLETLLKEKGITQKALAEMISTSEQTISKAKNGVRMTRDLAASIIKQFPEYNLSWLLGDSDVKTLEEANNIKLMMKDLEKRNEEMRKYDFFSSVAYIAEYCGFGADFDGAVLTIEERPRAFPDDTPTGVDLSAISSGCDELREDIVAFMKYRLQKAIDRGH